MKIKKAPMNKKNAILEIFSPILWPYLNSYCFNFPANSTSKITDLRVISFILY